MIGFSGFRDFPRSLDPSGIVIIGRLPFRHIDLVADGFAKAFMEFTGQMPCIRSLVVIGLVEEFSETVDIGLNRVVALMV